MFWGSTYLAIGHAIQTIPPFFMAAARFIIAGSILYVFARYVKGERVLAGMWRASWIMGALLLLGGNGGVVYAQQFVPSGMTALMIGAGPFWFVILGWLWLKLPRPGPLSIAGLVIGFTGLIILIGPGKLTGDAGLTPLLPFLVLVGSALSWSIGSIYSKTLTLPSSPMMMAALQMLAGSILMIGAGFLHGEHHTFDLSAVTPASWIAFAYLVVFGSLVGFSAYIYVLRHASPAVTATYAYVNPVVAVFLGWAVNGEPLTPRILFAASLIVGAVILISWPRKTIK